jgi:hypothetical protein
LPEAVAQWSLTSLREKLIKIGAKVVRHARYAVFQMAEVAVPKELFEQILRMIDGPRRRPAPGSIGVDASSTTGEVWLNDEGNGQVDGSYAVRDVVHAGSAGKTMSSAHGVSRNPTEC